MKKIVLSLFVAVVMAVPSFAAAYNSADRVTTVGTQLLNKNGIAIQNVKFTVVSGEVNNSEFTTDKVVNISSSKLSYAGNDNETAAVIANELGHLIAGHSSKDKVMTSLQVASGTEIQTSDLVSAAAISYKSTKEEKEADAIASNLMVNAGYNPLALIVVLTKQTGTYWDTIQGRPANAERAMAAYDYIAAVFPAKVKAGYGCNEYRNFLTYANSVQELRKNSKALQKKADKDVAKAKKQADNKTFSKKPFSSSSLSFLMQVAHLVYIIEKTFSILLVNIKYI